MLKSKYDSAVTVHACARWTIRPRNFARSQVPVLTSQSCCCWLALDVQFIVSHWREAWRDAYNMRDAEASISKNHHVYATEPLTAPFFPSCSASRC